MGSCIAFCVIFVCLMCIVCDLINKIRGVCGLQPLHGVFNVCKDCEVNLGCQHVAKDLNRI